MVSYVSLEQLEHYSGITLAGWIMITAWPASAVSLWLYCTWRSIMDVLPGRIPRSSRSFLPSHQMGEPCLTSFLSSLNSYFSVWPWTAVNAVLAERDIACCQRRHTVKSNECRCIYEMQASVYSNNSSQWGLSLWSTLRIDHLLNTSHPSCSLPF